MLCEDYKNFDNIPKTFPTYIQPVKLEIALEQKYTFLMIVLFSQFSFVGGTKKKNSSNTNENM